MTVLLGPLFLWLIRPLLMARLGGLGALWLGCLGLHRRLRLRLGRLLLLRLLNGWLRLLRLRL